MNEINEIQQQFGLHLLNFIKSKVHTTADAEDIYQEVLVTIINKIETLDNPESIKSWVFTIARNKIIDYFRQNQSKKFDTKDIESLNIALDEEHQNTYQRIEGCIAPLIEQLPVSYRKIIYASEIEGKSQKELSENLKINYVTLRSKIQRGRVKLKDILLENCRVQTDNSGGLADCIPKSITDCCNNNNEEKCGTEE